MRMQNTCIVWNVCLCGVVQPCVCQQPRHWARRCRRTTAVVVCYSWLAWSTAHMGRSNGRCTCIGAWASCCSSRRYLANAQLDGGYGSASGCSAGVAAPASVTRRTSQWHPHIVHCCPRLETCITNYHVLTSYKCIYEWPAPSEPALLVSEQWSKNTLPRAPHFNRKRLHFRPASAGLSRALARVEKGRISV